ncbi:MAG: glycoside hydrolase family 3 protein [Rubricoccaceae bacterium]
MPLSLREKAAGLLIVRLGSNMRPPRTAETDADGVARLLDRHPLGGVILFNGRWPETRQTLCDLQARSDRGLLVTTDMERGAGQQVAGATLYPHLAAFGVEEDPDAVRAFAEQSAREALACGIHVAYGPVADVDREPRNPIIGTRAFGHTPALVARLVRAYIEGARAAGLLTTAKHFPGHGGTADDSHATLPVLEDTAEALAAQDLPPFEAALAAGVDLVMTAHVAYPALDPSGRPATASAPILRGLLRERLGFTGAVVSDSLHMAGIKNDARAEADVAADLLAAGVDLFVDAEDPLALIEGLARAVEAGRLDEALLDAAWQRAEALRERLRARFGAGVFRDPSCAYAPAEVGRAEHGALAHAVARRALRVAAGPVPDFGEGEGLLVVLVKPAPRPNEPETMPLGQAVARLLPRARYAELEPSEETDDAAFERVLAEARAAERLVVATIVRPAAWHAFGLAARERRFVRALMELRPTTLAVLGGPRGLMDLDAAQAALVAYSDVPASQVALAERLAGR